MKWCSLFMMCCYDICDSEVCDDEAYEYCSGDCLKCKYMVDTEGDVE